MSFFAIKVVSFSCCCRTYELLEADGSICMIDSLAYLISHKSYHINWSRLYLGVRVSSRNTGFIFNVNSSGKFQIAIHI